jgi:preprotein translocase subunit YajC
MEALLPLVVLVFAFYLLILRPMQRRQRDQAAVAGQLAPGARVITHSGVHASVVSVADATVELELAPGVVTTWVKGAVARVLDDGEGESLEAGQLDGSHEALPEEPGPGADSDTGRP